MLKTILLSQLFVSKDPFRCKVMSLHLFNLMSTPRSIKCNKGQIK